MSSLTPRHSQKNFMFDKHKKQAQNNREGKSGNQTCTGVAAISTPATPPPKTLPSDPAKDTLSPPVLLRLPLLSDIKKEPDKEIISYRPCKENYCHYA